MKSRDWPSIERFYRNLIENHGWDRGPMLDLVREIQVSPLARTLHGTTPHDTLCVGTGEILNVEDGYARVRYDPRTARTFVWWSSNGDAPVEDAECSPADALEVLLRVLEVAPGHRLDA